MEKKDYKLTMTLDFKSVDHIGARLKAKEYLDSVSIDVPEVKLQRIFKDKPPEKVEL